MIRLAITLILALVVSACSVPTSQISEHDDGRYFLELPPDSLGRNLSMSQMVTGEYANKTYRVRYEVEIVGNRLTIVGLSPVGLTLFTLIQIGDTVTIDNRLREMVTFNPRYTLFDFYLTYWPVDVLRQALEKNKMMLEINPRNKERRVHDAAGMTIATVSFPPEGKAAGKIIISHLDPPYRLSISSFGAPRDK